MGQEIFLFVLGAVTVVLLQRLYRLHSLSRFLCNGILGLLSGVAAVCLSPALGLSLSLNLFTGGVCLYLGPAGAVGLLALSLLWR